MVCWAKKKKKKSLYLKNKSREKKEKNPCCRKLRECVQVRQYGVYKKLSKQTRSPVSPLKVLIEFTLR